MQNYRHLYIHYSLFHYFQRQYSESEVSQKYQKIRSVSDLASGYESVSVVVGVGRLLVVSSWHVSS